MQIDKTWSWWLQSLVIAQNWPPIPTLIVNVTGDLMYSDLCWMNLSWTLALQSHFGVVFSSLTLKWSRPCIWLVDVTMTHWRVDANRHCCCSKTKENIYISKHSGSLKELTVFTLLDSSPPNMYLPAQMLKSWKRNESYKLQCQAETSASLIDVGLRTCCMLTSILPTILIL